LTSSNDVTDDSKNRHVSCVYGSLFEGDARKLSVQLSRSKP